jgi:hypothetical protein
MLARINHVGDRTVRVTKLDIDDYGIIIPLKDLELKLPSDDSVIRTLKVSPYAAIFTVGDEDDGTIILAKGITEAELNREKEKTISAVNKET